MNISRKAILLGAILLGCLGELTAQVRQTREEYIDRYMHIAVAHMERYGIPASITWPRESSSRTAATAFWP